MSIKGQTHAKRAREFALREKREQKKAKKEDRRNGVLPEAIDTDGVEGTDGEPSLEPQPEPATEWVQ
ncbi:MAG: hypothetical protein QOG85_1673 [Gaiellaceae bacterium]|jgi:hypothetical protein|nr:hypothetical protein [Gaiellaceae bacterium]